MNCSTWNQESHPDVLEATLQCHQNHSKQFNVMCLACSLYAFLSIDSPNIISLTIPWKTNNNNHNIQNFLTFRHISLAMRFTHQIIAEHFLSLSGSVWLFKYLRMPLHFEELKIYPETPTQKRIRNNGRRLLPDDPRPTCSTPSKNHQEHQVTVYVSTANSTWR